MFLSRLILNSRNRKVVRDLDDIHEIHRTLLTAFPQVDTTETGARARSGMLFRVEAGGYGSLPMIIVQSELEPNWSALPQGYLVGATDNPASKRIDHLFDAVEAGMVLRFRLRANPTRRIWDAETQRSKRVGLYVTDAQYEWLKRKTVQAGFRLFPSSADPEVPAIRIRGDDVATARHAKHLRFHSVTFDGHLVVADPERFREALRKGIGSGKAYGFGLLSIGAAL